MLLEVVLVGLTAIATAYFFGVALPEYSRAFPTAVLHGIRADLYALGDANPSLRDTLTYRDTAFCLNVALHIVRDLDVHAAARVLRDLRGSGDRTAADEPSWRTEAYSRELAGPYRDHIHEWDRMIGMLDRIDRWLALRWAFGAPLNIAVVCAVGVPIAVADLARAARGPIERASRMVGALGTLDRATPAAGRVALA